MESAPSDYAEQGAGADLENPDQPIFVLGGISLRDEGWNKTHSDWQNILNEYFEGKLPDNFELHSYELLSPNGDGPFRGDDINKRLQLVDKAIDLLINRKHGIHFIAFDKAKINTTACEATLTFDPKCPYLLGFDYLVTYINKHIKDDLGSTARGIIIFDHKDEHIEEIENIFHNRRFGGVAAHRVKWIVEFGATVDSKKNPMIQLSDLVILCVRRFLEIEEGYKNPPDEVKEYYAKCYDKIYGRLKKKTLVERQGNGMNILNDYLKAVNSHHEGPQ